jgi:hypothetical protein
LEAFKTALAGIQDHFGVNGRHVLSVLVNSSTPAAGRRHVREWKVRQFGELESVIMDRLWQRGRPALATALAVLAAAAGPTPGLAAAATDAVQRIQRLLRPAKPLSRVRRQLLSAGAAALALTSVLLALAPAIGALALGRVPAA